MKIIKIAAFSAASAFVIPSQAANYVYEGFDYGLSNGTTMNGVTTNATGLTGNYAVGQSSVGIGTAVYTSAGLTFGSNFKPVTGGAMTMSITSNVNNTTRSAQVGAALNTGSVTGTVYTSYLYSIGSGSSATTPAATAQTRINGAQTTSTNTRLSVLGDGTQNLSNSLLYGSEATQSGTAGILSLSTIYLAVAKFTNVGTVGQTGTGEMWVLTQTGYDNWLTLGGGLESNLTAYAVTGSHLTTSTTTTANNATFGNSQFLSFAVSNASNVTAETFTIDEARYGSSLLDVINIAAVPEPSTYGIAVAVALGGLVVLRRRKARC